MIEVRDKNKSILNWLSNNFERYSSRQMDNIAVCSYYYYRSYNYTNVDSYNILRGLMAALEFSVEWRISENKEALIYRYDLKKRIYLKRFYYDFLRYIKYHTLLFEEIDRIIEQEYYEGKCDKIEIFDIVCARCGEEIVGNFIEFITRERPHDNIELNRIEIINSLEAIFNAYKNPYMYSEKNVDENVLMDFMNIISSDNVDYYHIFNFFSWLKKLNVDMYITKKELHSKIKEYILQSGLGFNNQMQSTLSRSFYGNKSAVNILRFLQGKAKNYHLSYQRYTDVFSHGILLLKRDTDFKDLKVESWDALQRITGNILDIYYCNDEVKGKLSGYGVLEKLEQLNVSITDLPALLLWREDINDFNLISFRNLNKESYIDIIVNYVESIKKDLYVGLEDGNRIFEKAFISASNEAVRLMNEKRGINLVYINKNEGTQQGNFGHFGTMTDNTIIANEQGAIENLSISSVQINELKEIVSKLSSLNVKDLEVSKKMEITLELQRFVETCEREGVNEQEKKLGLRKWRDFVANNHPKVLLAMGAVADIITISAPLLKLLGLSQQ
ncbi:hypothetical protein RW25_20475 [Bacillus sp. L_1B0_8]|uniref:hypothetical protein n=1 Tax=unclassified Bacillus (in: firmicutes) TaxID=185979 RepID=UPI0005B6B6B0|nr:MULTISPECIES: hypothetical protein [unclassified Bacillus (in: firmicutes)]KIQ82962.1 hypothetical protein RT27_23490 [Bacillus sp. L_1B0_5]KIQ85044.1 hypothetical protein RW25_20475 [Bacillus sp. L_1B0_8]